RRLRRMIHPLQNEIVWHAVAQQREQMSVSAPDVENSSPRAQVWHVRAGLRPLGRSLYPRDHRSELRHEVVRVVVRRMDAAECRLRGTGVEVGTPARAAMERKLDAGRAVFEVPTARDDAPFAPTAERTRARLGIQRRLAHDPPDPPAASCANERTSMRA